MNPIEQFFAKLKHWLRKENNAVTITGKVRNSAIDERTTRHQGYGMSQSRRG